MLTRYQFYTFHIKACEDARILPELFYCRCSVHDCESLINVNFLVFYMRTAFLCPYFGKIKLSIFKEKQRTMYSVYKMNSAK